MIKQELAEPRNKVKENHRNKDKTGNITKENRHTSNFSKGYNESK